MRLLMCFGGSAAVVDDDAAGDIEAAVVAARHRRHQRGRSLSFRRKFLSGSSKGKTKKPSATSSPAEAKKRRVDADDVYGLIRASTETASSVPSSALLSSATSSLGSDSSSASSRSSSVSSSASVSGVLFPPPAAKRQASNNGSMSPAAGVAAVVLCLLMVVFCGRVGATMLTSTALYLFPRRWPARSTRKEDDGVGSLECDAEETAKRKVVTEGFLVRNRKN